MPEAIPWSVVIIYFSNINLSKWHSCSRVICVQWCSGCRADANEAAVILLPSNITVFTLDFSGSGLSDGDYVSLGWHEVSYDFMNAFICLIRTKYYCFLPLSSRGQACLVETMLALVGLKIVMLSSWMLVLLFYTKEAFRLFLTIPLCGRKMIWRLWCRIWEATSKYPV